MQKNRHQEKAGTGRDNIQCKAQAPLIAFLAGTQKENREQQNRHHQQRQHIGDEWSGDLLSYIESKKKIGVVGQSGEVPESKTGLIALGQIIE